MNTIELSIPAKPAVISISTNSLEIQWSDYDIVDYFIHYEICVSTPGADVCEQKIETSNTQLTIRNLQASSDYSISIVVFTDFGTSPRSSALDIVTADISKYPIIFEGVYTVKPVYSPQIITAAYTCMSSTIFLMHCLHFYLFFSTIRSQNRGT